MENTTFNRKTTIFGISCLLLTIFLLFLTPICIFATTIFEDTFNNYDLGDLGGQGGWIKTGAYSLQVSDEEKVEGSKGLKSLPENETGDKKEGTPLQSGQSVIWVKYPSTNGVFGYGTTFLIVKGTDPTKGCGFRWYQHSTGYVRFALYSPPLTSWWEYPDTFENGVWHKVAVQWNTAGNAQCSIKVDDGDWLTSNNYHLNDLDLDTIKLVSDKNSNAGNRKLHFLDYISEDGELTPPPARIWGEVPSSGTTITDLNTTFSAKWEGIDPEIYDGIVLYFQNSRGINSKPLYLEIETATGTIETNFSDFDLDKNGNWFLRGFAYYEGLDVYGDLYLTPKGYIQKYTKNLVSPDYYIDLDIEGLEEVFEMENFGAWYSENVEEFDEPTPTFSQVADFFTPIFNKTGEFSKEIEKIVEVSDAYDKGYTLGAIFPLAESHFGIIKYFTGGFPLFEMIGILLILMLLVILIKILMKFVPFFH